MRELTEEEKEKLQEKLQEARASRTDRVLEMARKKDRRHTELARALRHSDTAWGAIATWGIAACVFPPLGIVIGIIVLAKGHKLVGASVLAASIGIFGLYIVYGIIPRLKG
jgi:Flp pilus assembly protein TadB